MGLVHNKFWCVMVSTLHFVKFGLKKKILHNEAGIGYVLCTYVLQSRLQILIELYTDDFSSELYSVDFLQILPLHLTLKWKSKVSKCKQES